MGSCGKKIGKGNKSFLDRTVWKLIERYKAKGEVMRRRTEGEAMHGAAAGGTPL